MPTPLVLDSITVVDLEPTYQPTPASLTRAPLPVVGMAAPTPTLVHGRPANPDEGVTFRSMAEEPWGSYRLVVGGVDVTYFDDVAVKIGGYQLTEPYGYGDAAFEFPQITSLMIDQWGSGDLAWFDLGKPVRLVKVDADLNFVRLIWKGFIAAVDPTEEGTAVTCAGDLSGRLALRDKHPALFTWFRDLGRWLWRAVSYVGRSLDPHLGPDTDIDLDTRGQSGTMLSYVDWMLAMWQEDDGDQGTIMPSTSGSGYEARLKDRTTVHYTGWNGAHGLRVACTRDLSEEFTAVYAQWQEPDGQVCVNGKYPGLIQGEIPTFPGTLSLGSTGDDVEALAWKLVGTGDLDFVHISDTFGAAIEDAVETVQRRAGLSVTGVVNSATWDVIWDLGSTGLSLRQAHQAPIVEESAVQKWLYTSNGARIGRNPAFDATRVPVDLTQDYGPGIRRRRVRRNARRILNKAQTGKNFYGTATLSADLAEGDAAFADVVGETAVPISRLDVEPGTNVQIHNYDGTTLFHIATVDVDSDQRVQLGIDTKARDALTLGQMLERDQASKQNLARQWLRTHRGTDANRGVIHFSEVGGKIFEKVTCAAGEWTSFPVVAGQSGTIEKVRLKTSNSATEFVLVLTAKRAGPAYLANKLGTTLAGVKAKLQTEATQDAIDGDRIILGVWGHDGQPCGYHPGAKFDPETGEATGDSITGLFLDEGGISYHTFDNPVVYMAILPVDACEIAPQRVLWPNLEPGLN